MKFLDGLGHEGAVDGIEGNVTQGRAKIVRQRRHEIFEGVGNGFDLKIIHISPLNRREWTVFQAVGRKYFSYI
jgi:hypothetical protein